MKPFPTVSTIIRLAVLAACGAVFLIFQWEITMPEARYQDMPEHYQMVYRQTGPADIVILGTSRPWTAFGAREISRAIGPVNGRPAVVYNLCRNWSGVEPDYAVLRDYLQRYTPRVVVLTFQTSSYDNEYFRLLSTHADAWANACAHPQWHWWKKIHFFLSESLQRTTIQLARQLTGAWRKLGQTPLVAASPTDSHGPNGVNPLALEPALADYRQDPAKRIEWNRDWAVANRERYPYYIQKVIALAREKGAEVLLVDVPGLFSGLRPYDQASAEAIADFFQVEFHQLSDDYLARLYTEGFGDHGHTNQYGREICSEWLAGILRDKLAPPGL